jgi:hypothetical protein
MRKAAKPVRRGKQPNQASSVWILREEINMESKSGSNIRVDAGIGMFWFIGWLFTIAFAKLLWWQAFLGLVIWPYYLGVAAR